MAAPEARRRISPEELLAIIEGDRFELVDGELRERCVSAKSSWVAGRLFFYLAAYAERAGGLAFPADVQLRCFRGSPHMVRKVDAAFVCAGQLPGELPPEGYLEVAPDVIAEVVSRHDVAEELEAKVRRFFDAGTRLAWIAYPATRTVHVYRADGHASVLDVHGTLTGEDVLPGFRVPVARLFPRA